MKSNSFFKEMKTIDKTLPTLMRNKRRKTQTIKTRKERRDISDSTEMERISIRK